MNASLARRANQVLKEARARHLTLATVESCTAGSLGAGCDGCLSRRFHRLHQGQQDPRRWRARCPSKLIPPSAAKSPKRWPVAVSFAVRLMLPSRSPAWQDLSPTRTGIRSALCILQRLAGTAAYRTSSETSGSALVRRTGRCRSTQHSASSSSWCADLKKLAIAAVG
jgi:hypothetical protein